MFLFSATGRVGARDPDRRFRWGRLWGLLAIPLVVAACGGEVLDSEGLRLRCDLGCGPDGSEILDGMLAARDSIQVWFQKVDPSKSFTRRRRATVRLHADPRTFERVEFRLAQGRFREQRAFSHARSLSAHILPEEVARGARWEAFGPGVSGPRLAIHEAAHLVVYQLVEDPRWPPWVSEGVASTLEEMWVRGTRDFDPWLDTRDHVRQVLLARGGLPGWDEILNQPLDRLALSSRYAVWAGFMEVLLQPPFREATGEALSVLASTAPRDGWTPAAVRQLFEAHFPLEMRRAVERAFEEQVRARTPQWVEYHRGSQKTEEGLLQVAADGRLAILWSLPSSSTGEAAECLRVTGHFVGPDSTGVFMLLGQQDATVSGVAVLTHSDPRPFVMHLHSESPHRALAQAWDQVRTPVEVDSTSIRVLSGDTLALTLQWEGSTLSLADDKGARKVWEIPEAPRGQGWGVGVMGAAEVLWTDLSATCS